MDPVIETERLILRRPAGTELEDWVTFAADVENMRFIGGAQPRSMAWRALATVAGSWVVNGYGMFSVIERASGRWIGRLGPWQPAGWPGPEIGWGFARDAQHQGYALEGVTAAIDFAIHSLGWTRFIHCIDPENMPSRALAAKLGSTNSGPGKMPAPYSDDRIDFWGQTAEQWKSRRTQP
jgi:RimJ/RimL family protein N-acetyltransferase